MTRVIVCGGRDFRNGAFMFLELDRLHALLRFTELMQGGALGADRLAREWAIGHPEIKRFKCKAEWTKHGNAAGAIRNTRMLEWNPDLVVAFPTGGPGTANMMEQAREAGVKVIEIKVPK
jgi:hypothetical protein